LKILSKDKPDLKMTLTLKTPSRLHLGLLDLNGSLNRIFGSIGVTIHKPGIVLEISEAGELMIQGDTTGRVEVLVRRFLHHYKIKEPVKVHLKERIPEHVGLGSGTQLSLAVAFGLAKFFQKDIPIPELARVMVRGCRSGIGIAAFTQGGFLVDGGHPLTPSLPQRDVSPPPILFRYPFPENWMFLVVIPEIQKGLSGEKEQRAFEQLLPVSPYRVGEVCRILVMQMLPALIEENLKVFGEALTQIQKLVGSYFETVQGGLFADKICEQLIEYMLSCGAAGAGQSSWGPTVYGLVEGNDQAQELASKVEEFLHGKVKATLFPVHGQNTGVEIIEGQAW
jgi:beta-RFAP synthase